MPVLNRIAEFHPDMTAWRRDFHQHPELGLTEHRTSARVAELLRQFGVDEVHTGIAQTGVVGVIHGQSARQAGGPAGEQAVGFRADMDALPIVEQSGVEHASQTPGIMHACGHDGHTTMLLGAARYLAETRRFGGTVYLIFQPAEENAGGGQIMVQEGLFERFPMKQVYGMHNWPGMPAGTFAWRDGPMLAAVSTIEITITGKGAHAAQPHQGTDPVVVGSAIVQALQSIVARGVNPLKAGVVTIGSFQAGHTHNVIPETARLLGTARWFEPDVGDVLERQVRSLAGSIAEGFGARAAVVYERTYPATVNDPAAMALGRRAAETVVGEAQVKEMALPTMAGEDFSFMLNAKQGAFIMLGTGRGPDDPLVHHPRYDFNDEMLPVGASYWAVLAEQLLPRE